MKDKHGRNKRVVAIEKLKDDYGSTVALKVTLYRRRTADDETVWEPKRSHTFSAAFSRRMCKEQAKKLARQWADKYDAKIVRRD